mmetsp:Transcript_16598/g.36803  ORF Transcript_16598/g.36803 Transcript_16598/m.36803 type:complete len:209 (-) Transcript_16598:1166-1792(-)
MAQCCRNTHSPQTKRPCLRQGTLCRVMNSSIALVCMCPFMGLRNLPTRATFSLCSSICPCAWYHASTALSNTRNSTSNCCCQSSGRCDLMCIVFASYTTTLSSSSSRVSFLFKKASMNSWASRGCSHDRIDALRWRIFLAPARAKKPLIRHCMGGAAPAQRRLNSPLFTRSDHTWPSIKASFFCTSPRMTSSPGGEKGIKPFRTMYAR